MATRLDEEDTSLALIKMLSWRLALGGLATWLFAWRYGPAGYVWSAVLWGVLLTRPIIESFGVIGRSIHAAALDLRGARLYTFQLRNLRVFLPGDRPWLVDTDLLAALDERPDPSLPRRFDSTEYAAIGDTGLHGFSEAGALRLLAGSRHPDALKLRLFLEREVFAPAKRRRAEEPDP
jgi:hypothetical protein